MSLILALHAVVGLTVLAAGAPLRRRAFALAAVAPVATLAWLATRAGEVLDGGTVTEAASWVAPLGLILDLRLDGFSLLMLLLVSGIGLLVLVYASSYFGPDEPGLHEVAGLLTLFAGAMVGLVLADNVLWLFVCWELTSVTSYLLIGWKDRNPGARAAALQAILITGAGGLAMLAGLVVLGDAAGTFSLSGIVAARPSGTAVDLALLLVVLGCITKSAQVPFSGWLPGAMVAPTPVSAYLHSATMVKAGVYLLARLAPAFAPDGAWRPVVIGVGLATMLLGGFRALRQYDLKLLLAYGTISQLGFLVVLFGAGLPEATLAGAELILAHGLFKAALFMVVGIVDHQAGSRDIRAVGPLGPGWGPTKVVAFAAAASMAGIPLLFGFVAKEAAYEAWVHGGVAGAGFVLAGVVGGAVLTFAYSARLVWGTFWPVAGVDPADQPAPVGIVPPPRWTFLAPAGLLTAVSVVLGVVPGAGSALIGAAVASLDPRAGEVQLKLWHGLNAALALSLVTMGTGALLFVLRRPVARVQASLPRVPTGDDAYRWCLRGLNRVADRVTGVVQNGSLPIYVGVILLTAVLVPGWGLVRGATPAIDVDGWSGPADLAVAVLIVAGTLVAVTVRRRIVAVLGLGVVGYGMGLFFVTQGAPDLALTQFSVETLGVVLFVLVLRRLPERFRDRVPPLGRAIRLVIAGTVGAFVVAFSLLAQSARVAPPVSGGYVDAALPEGGGRNVVNVILVDFRGLDTLGEITVLAVAAIGVVGLARIGRHRSAPVEAAPGAAVGAGAVAGTADEGAS